MWPYGVGASAVGLASSGVEHVHVDLYDVDYKNAKYVTPGAWSVLDMGNYNNSRTPAAYGAFERNALGWNEPRVLDGPADIELEHILGSNESCLIPTEKDTEFFLLENRQKKGWDAYVPGAGMLIWHIDYNSRVWQNNEVNINPSMPAEPPATLKLILPSLSFMSVMGRLIAFPAHDSWEEVQKDRSYRSDKSFFVVMALLGKGVQKDKSDIRNRRFYLILCLQKIKNFCSLCAFCPSVSLSPQKTIFLL